MEIKFSNSHYMKLFNRSINSLKGTFLLKTGKRCSLIHDVRTRFGLKIAKITDSDVFIKQARISDNGLETKITDIIQREINKNYLRVKKNINGELHFYDGSKNVGTASLRLDKNYVSPKGVFPSSWYVKGGTPNNKDEYPLYPFLEITELSMNDRINTSSLIKRDKKYGTLAVQRILEILYNKYPECEGRLFVHAGQYAKTGFAPGKFYNKVGFTPIPGDVEKFKRYNKWYEDRIQHLKGKGFTQEEAQASLKEAGLEMIPYINGEYVPECGYLYMVSPEKAFKI